MISATSTKSSTTTSNTRTIWITKSKWKWKSKIIHFYIHIVRNSTVILTIRESALHAELKYETRDLLQ